MLFKSWTKTKIEIKSRLHCIDIYTMTTVQGLKLPMTQKKNIFVHNMKPVTQGTMQIQTYYKFLTYKKKLCR